MSRVSLGVEGQLPTPITSEHGEEHIHQVLTGSSKFVS